MVLAETAGANYSSEEIKLGRAVYSWSAAASGGNQSEAARVSGLERSYLRKLLIKHGVLK